MKKEESIEKSNDKSSSFNEVYNNFTSFSAQNTSFIQVKPDFNIDQIHYFQQHFLLKKFAAEDIFEEIFYELNYKITFSFFQIKFKV